MRLPEFEVGKITIGDLVDLVATQMPDQMAVEYLEPRISHTYKEFNEICKDVAKGLMAMGVKKGEHIAIWANNVPEWLYLQFGSPKMGAVLVTVNTNYRAFELEYLLKQSDTTTLFLIGGVRSDDEYIKVINEVCPELKNSEPGKLKNEKLPFLKNIVFIGEDTPEGMYNWKDLMEMGKKVSDEELKKAQSSLSPDEVINMQYTSGTTGFPKGVMLTHTNIIGNAKSIAECMKFSPKDRLCIPVPFFHCFGCVLGTLTCLVSGATMCPVVQFKPDAVLRAVEELKCTALHGVPTMFIAELEEITLESIKSIHKLGKTVTRVKLIGASAKDLASKIKDEAVTTSGK
jgi:fatty-acyl-CoA synthase